jgi:hypothetical protein
VSHAEQERLAYLFRLRMTANVRRALMKVMDERDWLDAGQGWWGKEASLRLVGWSRYRRVILLRRKLHQPRLSFAEVVPGKEVWEYAALVTSLDSEVCTLAQLYRGRADCENAFGDLKNQWGWGGFTTHDLKRCRLLAGSVALIYNWWSLFVRLAGLNQRPEAITSRPLLLQAIARQTRHAGQLTLTITSTHGDQHKARASLPANCWNCEAVGPGATLVSHLERSAQTLPQRPSTRPAAASRSRLTYSLQLRPTATPAAKPRSTAGSRIKRVENQGRP